MIDLSINQAQREKNAKYCQEKGILLPTFEQMKDPRKVPQEIQDKLKNIGLWDINPLNLFRINWKNEPIPSGGGFHDVNYIKLPSSLTGTKANLIALIGKWFPTGAHKVGATYGCLCPKLITGQFNPQKDKAVWPSTGNYCRGGAYVSSLLGCNSIAILPEEMSKERFEWLSNVAGEVIATPGCESNVKEIFDKCWELRNSMTDISIFNQFDEFGNLLWHYHVTGSALEEIIKKEMGEDQNFSGTVLSSGSAGTLGSAYYLQKVYPNSKIGVSEALQCPTLLYNGFGGHRIEGIGDKHVPWIHDLKSTNMVLGIDDELAIRILRLFNEKKGQKLLKKKGIDPKLIDNLELLGISGIANLISAIKFAKYYELTEKDYVATVFTDSMQLYGSRIQELTNERGKYQEINAEMDFELLKNITIDNIKELTYYQKKTTHNLKYFTWIEQQQKSLSELNDQWYDHRNYWNGIYNHASEIDKLINQFNEMIVR